MKNVTGRKTIQPKLRADDNSGAGDAGVQSVDRALLIIETLAEDDDGYRLTDLAVRTGLSASTVHRLLTTLEKRRFVQFARHESIWHIGAQSFADLQDLQLRLGDAPPGLGRRGDQRAALAFEPGGVALERRQAIERCQVLLPQVANALQFLLDPVDLPGLGGLLLDVALDLLAKLGDLLLELGLLPFARAAADLEQLLLARRHLARFGIVEPCHKVRREAHRRRTVAGGRSVRVLIVDDEHLARQAMRRLRAAHPDAEIVGEAASLAEAVEAIERTAPQLVFPDIALGGGGDGFDLLAALERPPIVVFVTAYAEHAVEAFAVNAVDYLLKPVEPARLAESLGRAERQLDRVPVASGVIALRTPKQTVLAQPAEIAALRADGDFNYVFIADQPAVMIWRTLGHFEELLPSPPFLRLGRSLIINCDRLRKVETPSRAGG